MLGFNKKSGSFIASVLKPFSTEPMKLPYDYPLNTTIVEQTLEFNLYASLGNGTGVINNNTYGIVFVVSPHSFNDFYNVGQN